MSKETVLKIIEAEADAKRIISEAHREAEARMDAAREVGETLCKDTERTVSQELSEIMDQLRAKLAEMEMRVSTNTEREAAALSDLASLNRRAAEKIIISGVNAKCR
jgi:vacuolar-type H+-ATPase subunit H